MSRRIDWQARQASIEAGRRARLRMQAEKREAARLAREIAEGKVCGDHERPAPCGECATDE